MDASSAAAPPPNQEQQQQVATTAEAKPLDQTFCRACKTLIVWGAAVRLYPCSCVLCNNCGKDFRAEPLTAATAAAAAAAAQQEKPPTTATTAPMITCAQCDTVLSSSNTQDDAVQLYPCGCWLCRRTCIIDFLTQTRLDKDWTCKACGEAVESHSDAAAAAAATKPTTTKGAARKSTSTRKRKAGSNGTTTSAKKQAKDSAAASTGDNQNNNNDDVDDATSSTPSAKSSSKLLLPKKKYNVAGRGPRLTFAQRLDQLRAYKAEFGHVRVPHRYTGSEQNLGEWVKNVRRGIKQISKEERKELNALGFVWETKYNKWDREWKEMLERLRNYKERFGDCYVPWQWSEDKKLAEWVHTQRKDNKKGKLREDRKQVLVDVGFAFVGLGASGKRQSTRNGTRATTKKKSEPSSSDDSDEEEEDEEEPQDDHRARRQTHPAEQQHQWPYHFSQYLRRG